MVLYSVPCLVILLIFVATVINMEARKVDLNMKAVKQSPSAVVIASLPGLADPSHIADESFIASYSSDNSKGSDIANCAPRYCK